MSILLEFKKEESCEQIYSLYDRKSGLKAIIAIHNTALGAAIGGCRMMDYISENEALADVTRLAKNMTYKSAMAGVKYGGGKSVILKPKNSLDRKLLFTTFGKFINKLQGQYITAIDSGTTLDDMEIISHQTPYVTGYAYQIKRLINPAYYTALGVLQSLYAAIAYKYNCFDLIGKKILIKGVGNVGYCLAKLLHKQNIKLFISDLDIQKAKRYENELKATFVDPDAIFNNNYNIVCPCDTEFTVTEKNILSIKTDILLGATNNQLEHDYLADELANKGILYCPDYVVNSGGLIYVAALYEKKSTQDILDKIKKLSATTENILKYADTHQISTKASADKMAEEIITSSYEEKITA